MKLIQFLAPAVGLFAAASATPHGKPAGTGSGGYTTTVITTDYETYCPSPTTFAFYNVTYTVTTPCTVTITNCPCTLSYTTPPPVTTTSYYTAKPPPSGTGYSHSYYNASSTYSVETYTPPPSTYLVGTTPVSSTPYATKTPVGPTSTSPVAVVTGGAARFEAAGAILAAGLAVLAL
ncbi:hypothetical protein BX600DRAFT_512330 [Xylariales sp. PMI_506]|nr:hypothetical protein BX600DRAFT_512330 [Xylariales sp. PMI_506]